MTEAPYAQVKTNPTFEKGWNRLQVAIEIATTAIVVAALLGLLGTGPLSRTSTGVAGRPIDIVYDRILRRTLASDMVIDLREATGRSKAEIEMPTALLDVMDIVTTSPRASSMRSEADGIVYAFDLGAAETGRITISMKPKAFGLVTSDFVVGGTRIALRQLILP